MYRYFKNRLFVVSLQLRTHLGHIYKHQNQQRAININNPDSQHYHLETRLVQLDSAIQMELWQVSHLCFHAVFHRLSG